MQSCLSWLSPPSILLSGQCKISSLSRLQSSLGSTWRGHGHWRSEQFWKKTDRQQSLHTSGMERMAEVANAAFPLPAVHICHHQQPWAELHGPGPYLVGYSSSPTGSGLRLNVCSGSRAASSKDIWGMFLNLGTERKPRKLLKRSVTNGLPPHKLMLSGSPSAIRQCFAFCSRNYRRQHKAPPQSQAPGAGWVQCSSQLWHERPCSLPAPASFSSWLRASAQYPRTALTCS